MLDSNPPSLECFLSFSWAHIDRVNIIVFSGSPRLAQTTQTRFKRRRHVLLALPAKLPVACPSADAPASVQPFQNVKALGPRAMPRDHTCVP
jgi:hypothetical protein